MPLFMDQALARRLERAEGAVNASFIETRRRLSPDSNAAWAEVAGAFLLFDGPASPMTQTFGLGMAEPVEPHHLSEMEAFFFDRGADVFHEVSPLAGVGLFAMLAERGYRPVELTTILAQPLDGPAIEAAAPEGLSVRAVNAADRDAWIDTSVAGWAELPEIAPFLRDLASVTFHNPVALCFVVEAGGAPIATGSITMHEGVMFAAGASTVPAARGRGAQRALLSVRLAEAQRRGCTVAAMGALPGSTSQRNAERSGFRVAYTRTKWRLPRQ